MTVQVNFVCVILSWFEFGEGTQGVPRTQSIRLLGTLRTIQVPAPSYTHTQKCFPVTGNFSTRKT